MNFYKYSQIYYQIIFCIINVLVIIIMMSILLIKIVVKKLKNNCWIHQIIDFLFTFNFNFYIIFILFSKIQNFIESILNVVDILKNEDFLKQKFYKNNFVIFYTLFKLNI